MAISVLLLNVTGAGDSGNIGSRWVANQAATFIVGVTNGASDPARTINSISVFESTESDAQISQPNFQTPNTAPGTGNPILLPGATSYFPFAAVFNSPNAPGVSPGNAPGGTAPGNDAQEVDSNFMLTATVVTADGQVVSASLMVPVLSAIAPAPSQGGALQLNNPMNLASFLAAFA